MHRISRGRRAIATLELVLVLPVVLTLLVALIWLGFSVISQAEVTVVARHEVWSDRFEPWPGNPFDFNGENTIESEASDRVEVTPLLDQEEGPSSIHWVEQGNWDHQSVAFDSALNLERMAELLVAAKTVGLIGDIENIREVFGDARSLGENILQEVLQEIASRLTDPRAELESLLEQGKQRVELEKNLAKSKAEGALSRLRDELERVTEERDTLTEGEDAADLSWLLDKRIERLELQIKLARERLKLF